MPEENLSGSKILLIEDEESLAVGLEFNLTEEGYNVDIAKDGKEAVKLFEENEYDLIILDIMLPYLDGFEVADIIRNSNPQMPILMLTARTSADDKVKGLQIGADDYLTKPFNLQELLLRVKGMLKRKEWYKVSSNKSPVYKFGNNTINFRNFNCKKGDVEFQLTQREILVIKYLIENKGKIVSRKELLENVWQMNSKVETRTVDNFIARLRKYFEDDPGNPVYIKSVRSAGYIFDDKN